MKVLPKLAACAAALAIVAGCGPERGADGLTAEERERLNQLAENADSGADVVDASPDSLVANSEWVVSEADESDNAINAAATNGQ